MAEEKKRKELKYKHRTLYLFLVLLALNLIWDIFVSRPHSIIQFLFSILFPICFALFYFLVRNLKRRFSPKLENKISLTGSIVFVPFVYTILVIAIITVVGIFSAFIDRASTNSVKTSSGKNAQNIVVGINADTRSESVESKISNIIMLSNVFICKFSQVAISFEHPGFYKTYHLKNYINTKETATKKAIIISLLASALLQLFSVMVSENVIYPRFKRKKKRSSKKKLFATPPPLRQNIKWDIPIKTEAS